MSEMERDREVDAAWRAASREEPPAALDEAVRAEARRAVGAGPGARPRHAWRYPAAAAATVALLAFGIAQMTSRDEVEPLAGHQAVAPSTPAESAAPAAPAPRKDAAAREERFASPPPPGAASGTLAIPERAQVPAENVQRPALAAPATPAKTTTLDEVKAKEAGASSVEAWVARIRELLARGEREAAAKELAAFRAAYGERAAELLPPDLRDSATP